MMLNWIVCLFLLSRVILLEAEEIIKTIDYGKLRPCCDAESPNWKTGQLAFNSAPEVGSFLTYLKKTYDLNIAIETGTFKGNTTTFLSLLFDHVYTIEIVEPVHRTTAKKLEIFSNVECLLGSSEVVLADLLPRLRGKRVLFYLDAHWESHWPLREELKEISRTHYDNCILVIDDFKVPGRPEIPFDKYQEKECSIDYIQDELKQIFSDYDIYYIIPTNLHSRAKLLVLPKNMTSL